MIAYGRVDSLGPVDSLVRVQVRPNDRDVQGHVNNAVALEYFEVGRWHWFTRHGLSCDKSVAPVVSRLEIDYLAQITHTQVEVATRLVTPNGLGDNVARVFRAIFRQEICVPDLVRPVARALVTIAFVDQKRDGKPVSLREYLDRGASVGDVPQA